MTLAATPATYTKGDLVGLAFAELGLAVYVFDLKAEQKSAALLQLRLMMGEQPWKAVPFNKAATPADEGWANPSAIPDEVAQAVYTNLALRMAPGYGKSPSADTRRAATAGLTLVAALTADTPVQELPSTLPVGAGNRAYSLSNYYPAAAGEP